MLMNFIFVFLWWWENVDCIVEFNNMFDQFGVYVCFDNGVVVYFGDEVFVYGVFIFIFYGESWSFWC